MHDELEIARLKCEIHSLPAWLSAAQKYAPKDHHHTGDDRVALLLALFTRGSPLFRALQA